jgi:purine-binding chemotaxis protein CheW
MARKRTTKKKTSKAKTEETPAEPVVAETEAVPGEVSERGQDAVPPAAEEPTAGQATPETPAADTEAAAEPSAKALTPEGTVADATPAPPATADSWDAWELASREITTEELAEILQARARVLAQVPLEEDEGAHLEVVVFTLGEETYAVEAGRVAVIQPLERWTPVPCTPDFVLGVINLRGRVLSVIDLHRFLGQEGVHPEQGVEVIVVKVGRMELGIAVNRVQAVRSLNLKDLEPALSAQRVSGRSMGGSAAYARGVTADMLVLLDLEALLGDERIVVWEEVG